MSQGAASRTGIGQSSFRKHPVLARFLADPVAATAPEISSLFWVIRILTTAGGQAGADFPPTNGDFGSTRTPGSAQPHAVSALTCGQARSRPSKQLALPFRSSASNRVPAPARASVRRHSEVAELR
jgi:hypothetical protein